jgi:hypothetical protein
MIFIYLFVLLAGVVGFEPGTETVENGGLWPPVFVENNGENNTLQLLSRANEAIREANYDKASLLLHQVSKSLAIMGQPISSNITVERSNSTSSSFQLLTKDCLQARWLIASRVLASSYHSVVADLSPLLIERNFEASRFSASSKTCAAELVPLLRLIKFIESNDVKSAEKEWRNNIMLDKSNSTKQSPLEMLIRAEEKYASAHLKRLAVSSSLSSNTKSDTTTSSTTATSTTSAGHSSPSLSDDIQKKIHSLTTAVRMQKEAREIARASFSLFESKEKGEESTPPFLLAKSSLLARSLYSSAEALYQLGQIERSAQYFDSAARESLGLSHKHPLLASCLSMAALVQEEAKYNAASSLCLLSSGEASPICLEMVAVKASNESLQAYNTALNAWSRVPSSIRQFNSDWAIFVKRVTLASARASPSWLRLSQLEASVFNSQIDDMVTSTPTWHSSSIFSFLPQLTARALGREGDSSSSLGLTVLKESLTSLAAIQSASMSLGYALASTISSNFSLSSSSSTNTSSTSWVPFDYNLTRPSFFTSSVNNSPKYINQSSLFFKLISQLSVLAPASLKAAVYNISILNNNNINSTSNTISSNSLTSSMALLLMASNLCESERAVDIATIALVRDELIKTGGTPTTLSSFSSFSASRSSSSSSTTTLSPSSPHFSLDVAKAAADVAGLIVDPNRHYGKPGQSNAIISAVADADVIASSSSSSFFWPFTSSSSEPKEQAKVGTKSTKGANAKNGKKQKQSGNNPSHATGKEGKGLQTPVDPGFDRYSFDSFNEDGSGGFYSSEQSLRYAREAHAQALLEAKAKNSAGASINAAAQPASSSSSSKSALQQNQQQNNAQLTQNQALNLAWTPRAPPNHLMVGLDNVRTDAIRRISDVFVRCYVAYFACKSKDVKGKTVVSCENQRVANAPTAFIDIFKPPKGELDNALGMLTPLGLDYLDLLLYEVLASAYAAREKGVAPPEWDFAFQQKGSRAGLPTIVFKK